MVAGDRSNVRMSEEWHVVAGDTGDRSNGWEVVAVVLVLDLSL
jgi:hypothetical protein